jgi:uncharacterized protein YceK
LPRDVSIGRIKTVHGGAFVALSIIVLMAGCASVPQGGAPAESPSVEAPLTTLYVARRRWHIDVGFDVADLQGPLAQVTAGFPGTRYAFFGFGDRHYLMARNRDAPVLLAALWPGAGLILVTTIGSSPAQAFGAADIIELRLTREQMSGVQDFIARSLSPGRDGTVESSAPGPYEGSAYFAATPRYSAFHTCITWAAEALRAGGLPIRARLTLVAGQLWRQVQRLRQPDGSIAGRRIAVLTDHRGAVALGDHDRGFGRRGRAAAADAARQQAGRENRTDDDLHYVTPVRSTDVISAAILERTTTNGQGRNARRDVVPGLQLARAAPAPAALQPGATFIQ